MSTKRAVIWVVILLIPLAVNIFGENTDDPILSYYTKNASAAYASRQPLLSGVSFSFTAKTYYKLFSDKNVYVLMDSAITTYYYSFGELDSTQTILKPKEQFDSLSINYPNIFTDDYIFNFFPNDTSSESISIGFDSPTFNEQLPVGLAVIDRNQFYLQYLYLYHLNEKKFKRWSEGYRFVEKEGYVFPDSIWTIKSRRKLLGNEHYRYETGISDVTIYR